MAIVEDFYIGKTHIQINDDYFCKPEEIQIIIDRASRKASLALQAEARRKAQENAKEIQE